MALPTNYDWATGFFQQACYDYFHGRALRRMYGWSQVRALSLAQLQQAAEKSMKAAAYWELRERLQPDDGSLMSHEIWSDLISRNKDLRGLKNALLEAIGVSEEKIGELKRYAPHGTYNTPNTEYPWRSTV
ncbi:MAG: hypothetical protein V1899_00395 [Planctomycetota bacterium]